MNLCCFKKDIKLLKLYLINPQKITIYIENNKTVQDLIDITLKKLNIIEYENPQLIFSNMTHELNIKLIDIGIYDEAHYNITFLIHKNLINSYKLVSNNIHLLSRIQFLHDLIELRVGNIYIK